MSDRALTELNEETTRKRGRIYLPAQTESDGEGSDAPVNARPGEHIAGRIPPDLDYFRALVRLPGRERPSTVPAGCV